MKKLFVTLSVLVTVLLCAFLLSSCESNADEEITLYVYNWGEYISDGTEDSLNVNAEFEAYCREELGKNVKVNYSTYSSNEDMYAKITSGQVAYDVIVPSDYMIARLASEGWLKEINPAQTVENYQYIAPAYKGVYYDPQEKYSVPYTFGVVGMIYNTTMVPETEENLGSWALMWDQDYAGQVLQFRNPRDAFATAQFYLGKSVNSQNPADWYAAKNLLLQQKNDLRVGYVMDEIFGKMQNGSAAVASYYAGDFFTMYEENEDLAFYYPREGTNIFIDAMCVPKNAENAELAIEYINFMNSEEMAIANAEYICYASPNILVQNNESYRETMTDVHPDAMEVLYGFDDSNLEYFHDLPNDTRALMNTLWEELKIESSMGITVYILCGVFGGTMIGIAVWRFAVRRKRRKYY